MQVMQTSSSVGSSRNFKDGGCGRKVASLCICMAKLVMYSSTIIMLASIVILFTDKDAQDDLARKAVTQHSDSGVIGDMRSVVVKFKKLEATCEEALLQWKESEEELINVRRREHEAKVAYEHARDVLKDREAFLDTLYEDYRDRCAKMAKWSSVLEHFFEKERIGEWETRFEKECKFRMEMWEDFDALVEDFKAHEHEQFEIFKESKDRTDAQEGKVLYWKKEHHLQCQLKQTLENSLHQIQNWAKAEGI